MRAIKKTHSSVNIENRKQAIESNVHHEAFDNATGANPYQCLNGLEIAPDGLSGDWVENVRAKK